MYSVAVILVIAWVSLAQALPTPWSFLTQLAEWAVLFSTFPNPSVAQVYSAQGFLPLGSAAAVHISKPNQTKTVSNLSMQQGT